MHPWIDDLEDAELYARLCQHGVTETRAHDLVAARDDWACSHTITSILDPDMVAEDVAGDIDDLLPPPRPWVDIHSPLLDGPEAA